MDTLTKILNEMKTKKISQREMAKLLGMTENNVSGWKAGRNKSYLKYISQIADILGVSADYLLDTDEYGQKENPTRESEAKKLYELYSKLPPEAQKQVEGLMRTWVESK